MFNHFFFLRGTLQAATQEGNTSFGELYKGASLCYLLRNDANLFVCPPLLDLFVGAIFVSTFFKKVFIEKVVCTKVRQQCIWAGGIPMHYSNTTAAAL